MLDAGWQPDICLAMTRDFSVPALSVERLAADRRRAAAVVLVARVSSRLCSSSSWNESVNNSLFGSFPQAVRCIADAVVYMYMYRYAGRCLVYLSDLTVYTLSAIPLGVRASTAAAASE